MCMVDTIKKSWVQKKLNPEDPKELAKVFAELSEAIKFLEGEIAPIKTELVKQGQTILLPELEKKILFIEGGEMSEIDAASLGHDLIDSGRTEDFLSVASVTETSLKKLVDFSTLLNKFKKFTGKKKADTVSLREMTKKEVTESKTL